MRKTLITLLLAAILLGLAACGQTPAADPADAAPSLEELYNGYLDAVSPDFAYDIALELTTDPTPPPPRPRRA